MKSPSLLALARATGRTMTLAITLAMTTAACGDGGGKDSPDAAPDGPAPAKCFEGTPTNHAQLINACVSADVEKIDKKPVLPRLNPDGTLPPIP